MRTYLNETSGEVVNPGLSLSYHATSKSAVFTGNPWVPHFSGSRKSTEVQPCVCLHSYGHLSVISTYNPVYRMYNPIYN